MFVHRSGGIASRKKFTSALQRPGRIYFRWASLWAATWISLAGMGLFQQTNAKETFPNKPITWVVNYGAGGGTDIFARAVQPFAAKYLGVPVVIQNIPGGSGIIGNSKVYASKPDGYTIIVCALPSFFIDKIIYNSPYEPENFTPVASWADMPMVLATHTEFESFNQFIQTARKRKLSIGHSAGVGGITWLLNLLMEKELGIEFDKVPYSASGGVAVGVAGKHLDACIMTSGAILPLVKSGQLRPLVALYEKRDLLYPQVPTSKELGYKFPVTAVIRGVVGPPNMPKEVVKTLETAFLKVASDPEYVETARKMNIVINPINAENYRLKWQETKNFLAPFHQMLKKQGEGKGL